MDQTPQKLPKKLSFAAKLGRAAIFVFLLSGIWFLAKGITLVLSMKEHGKRSYISRCASALAGVKTAQEIFFSDHNRYAKSLHELNFYKGRVYIEEKKVAHFCKSPKTHPVGKGYIITGSPTAVFDNCKLTYTETNNSTKGVCQ